MDKQKVIEALNKLFEQKGTRKFSQSVDLIINLKDIDLKKTEQQLDIFVGLPYSRGRPVKICGFVGPELNDEAKKEFDAAFETHDFPQFKDVPSKIKKLAEEYDFFVAQANVMPQVATVFGKVLGPRGKMPNPKAGCVVPPKSALKPLKEKLSKSVRISAKTSLAIKLVIGKEDQKVDELVENILTIYNSVIGHTVQGKNNIRNVLLKLTMSKPVKVE
jgi:large subunit ribosomal protein L1